MTLDASVHCDCYERGLVRTAPPDPEFVYIDECGLPDARIEDAEKQKAFWRWLERRDLCEHEWPFTLIHRYLGNITGCMLLRTHVDTFTASTSVRLPILRDKVIYSGTHAGDSLKVVQVHQLMAELDQLETVPTSDLFKDADPGYSFQINSSGVEYIPYEITVQERDKLMRNLIEQLRELGEVSLCIGKPIAF